MGMTIDSIIDFINRLTEFEGRDRDKMPPSLNYFMDVNGFGHFKYAMKKAYPNVAFEFIHPDERMFSFANPIMKQGCVHIKYRRYGNVYKDVVYINMDDPVEYSIGKITCRMNKLMKNAKKSFEKQLNK